MLTANVFHGTLLVHGHLIRVGVELDAKPSNHDISYVTHTVKSKSQRRTKIRKLLFLLCVLVGILVALTGIIVGFVVLAPFDGSGGLCVTTPSACLAH